ncbi:MAG: hypothetical protein F6K30_15675 [Cyanothece sp. SIO2G6]|nr:hypothetical protein [Cyanothece sp. SIO2G6]
MPQKMHSKQHNFQPILDQSPNAQSDAAAMVPRPTVPSASSHQTDAHQDWCNNMDARDVPNLSSKELVKLADTSADELMDAVFEDVDYMLDKGVSIVPKRAAGEATDLAASGAQPSEAIAPSSSLPSDSLPPATYPDPSADATQPANVSDPAIANGHVANGHVANGHPWNNAIGLAFPILGACATLGVTLSVGWLLYGPNPILRPNGGATAANVVTGSASSSNREFADYMERALESIVATEETSFVGGSETAAGNDSGETDESVNGRRFADVPERVYIPVYQPPQPSFSALPTVPITGTPAPTPLASSVLDPPASPTNAPLTPVPLASTPPVPIAPPTPAAATPSTPELSYDHVLVGLLQLGDRSVAMFDYAEGTHRVKVGEHIGTSGWSLVSVSETEAVIRRNGDVRSIYIGQSF